MFLQCATGAAEITRSLNNVLETLPSLAGTEVWFTLDQTLQPLWKKKQMETSIQVDVTPRQGLLGKL